MGGRIFVGNLSYGTNEESLRQLFENGQRTIKEVRIITDRETGRSRGFGFVELVDDDAARSAIEELNGAELDGRRLSLREAYDRAPRPGGGGGGAPRGRGPAPPVEDRRRGNGRPPRGPRDGGFGPAGPPPLEMMEDLEARGRGQRRRTKKKKRDRGEDFEDDDW